MAAHDESSRAGKPCESVNSKCKAKDRHRSPLKTFKRLRSEILSKTQDFEKI